RDSGRPPPGGSNRRRAAEALTSVFAMSDLRFDLITGLSSVGGHKRAQECRSSKLWGHPQELAIREHDAGASGIVAGNARVSSIRADDAQRSRVQVTRVQPIDVGVSDLGHEDRLRGAVGNVGELPDRPGTNDRIWSNDHKIR